MDPLLSAILFHPTYNLLLLVASILVPFLVIVLAIIGTMRNLFKKPPFPYRITEETWKATEQNFITDAIHHSNIQTISYSYKDSLTYQYFQAQALKARSLTSYDASKPPMVLVHGTGGCALSWGHVIDYLTLQCSDLYILNLPGFSYSDGPKELLSAADEQVWDFYTHFLEETFTKLEISSAIVVAHSYGAFHTIKFASHYPKRIQKLVLMDCPGLHPTLGDIGPYWALMFTAAFPQCLVRFFGNLAIFSAYTLYDLFLPKPILYYDLQIWARSWADKTVAKFFTHQSIYTHWHGFLLQEVLQLQMPVSFIYGEKDFIIPPHHATILSKIADGQVPTYIIQGAGHNPADSKEYALAFSKTVAHALQTATSFGPKAKDVATKLDKKAIASFRSTFCWNWTGKKVQEYYAYLQSLFPNNTQAGSVYQVNKAGDIALVATHTTSGYPEEALVATSTPEGGCVFTHTSPEVHSHPLLDAHASQ